MTGRLDPDLQATGRDYPTREEYPHDEEYEAACEDYREHLARRMWWSVFPFPGAEFGEQP
jgi:hypothetical protein